MSEEQNKYLEEYYKNEYDANKKITNALSVVAVFLLVIWVLYLIPGIFRITETTRLITCIALPVFSLS